MIENFIDRIKLLINHKNLTINSFDTMIESKGSITKFLRGDSKDIGYINIMKIINQSPEINPSWLLTGEGDMLRSEKTVHQFATSNTDQTKEIQHLRELLAEKERTIQILLNSKT